MVMDYVVVAYTVMAFIVVAYILMAYIVDAAKSWTEASRQSSQVPMLFGKETAQSLIKHGSNYERIYIYIHSGFKHVSNYVRL